MKNLLPKISDREEYKKLFPESRHWESAVSYLTKKYSLTGFAQRGELGSHIVYRVGDHWIKLMAPIFCKDMSFEISGLKVIRENLSVPTPRVVAEGEIEGWAYVILSHVEGEAIRNVWHSSTQQEKCQLTDQMAKILLEIMACKADSVINSRFQWNPFITEQYNTWETHQKRKGLSAEWLKEIPKFLSKFPISEFMCADPVFLHSDLTFDHFLVQRSPQARISGIIDMADCQVGHFEYELVAPCTFIFKGQKELLRRFLLGCGYQISKLDRNFSEKLLAWAILHRYYSMVSYFKDEMDSCEPGDFQELAHMVYPL